MGDKRADTKPLSFIGKSEIAQKADTLEAPDFPPEVLEQAEEAGRAFDAQAEEATRAMQDYIERGERRQ